MSARGKRRFATVNRWIVFLTGDGELCLLNHFDRLTCFESMFVFVPEARSPHVEIRVNVCAEDSVQRKDSVAP